MDDYRPIAAVLAVLIAGAWVRYETRRRTARAAGAPANAWERPAQVGRVSMTPGAWIILVLVGAVLLSLVAAGLRALGL